MKFEITTQERPGENVFLKYSGILGRFVTSQKGDKYFVELNTPKDFTRLAKAIGRPLIVGDSGTIIVFDGLF